jgi:hypothetical protein
MRVIPPLTITPAMLTSSTCAEPHASETAYNPATTYGLGDVVVVAADHRTYESLQAGNTGHTPSTSPTWWEDVGPTNCWKMFDILRNTQTEQASPLTVVITPGVRVNSIAVLGLEATSVSVSMTGGGPTVYTHTEDLNTRDVGDWYDYFFAPFSTRPSIVRFDLPPYSNGIITVAITNAAGDALCGSLVLGSYEYIGQIEWNPESDALNFSTVDRDVFGNAELVQRRSVPKTTQTLKLDKSRVDRVRNLRTALNAQPAVWSGLDDLNTDGYFEALLILGFYRKFTISPRNAREADIALELEEI